MKTPGKADITQAREGSALYYALLSVPAPRRQAIVALLHACRLLAEAFVDVSDAGVLNHKRDWWQLEIDRLQLGEPRHPQFLVLQPILQSERFGVQGFVDIVAVAEAEWRSDWQDENALNEALDKDMGARLLLVCQLLSTDQAGNSRSNPEELLQALSPDWIRGLGLFERLASFRHRFDHGYRVFPVTCYQEHELATVNNQQPLDARARSGLQTLLQAQIDKATDHLAKAVAQDGVANNAHLLPLLVYGRIRLLQLRRWRKSAVFVYDQYQTPTPIRKAWIAWRSASHRFPGT